MTRKIPAISLILASNMGVATEVTPPNRGTLFEKWEPTVLVLFSLALQVILALLANQRKHTSKIVIRIIIWSAYMAADSVATFTLGVISTNLHCALENDGLLDASIELATFWAPFLLLHLGGPDTITAFALQDTELWLRHFSNLIVQTGLALYIFSGVMKRSRLSTLSAMMLVAGVIKYGERTLCLWFASYNCRRSQALEDYDLSMSQAQSDQSNSDQAQLVQWDDENVENEVDEELLAIKMFQKTEHMFADVLQHDPKSSSNRIVQTKSSSEVSKLITMELELMYENLYTKAKVTHSRCGLALRLISLILILINLISFSCLHHRHNYSTFQLSVTLLLLVVAILLEGYAAFVFLTSSRTISWLRKHGMNTASQAMKNLSSLRTPSWSNSMGQFSLVNSSVRLKYVKSFSEAMSVLYAMVVNLIMKKSEQQLFVSESPVKEYVEEGIHEYLNQAEAKYKGGHFSIVNSRGRVPLTTWKEQYRGRAEDDPTTWLNFDMEFGEMVILWHFVTEVCYYVDYDSLIGEKGNTPPPEVYVDWKISKYLSRYLIQLYVVSSDMLPPRGPLFERKFFSDYYGILWRLGFDPDDNRVETSNPEEEEERNGKAADDQQNIKRRRKRDKVQVCRNSRDKILEGRYPEIRNPIFVAAVKLTKALLIEEDDPQANASKRNRNWKLLSEVWIELLVIAANQCRGNQHAQHLSLGGELLTHVWVLLGHLDLIESW